MSHVIRPRFSEKIQQFSLNTLTKYFPFTIIVARVRLRHAEKSFLPSCDGHKAYLDAVENFKRYVERANLTRRLTNRTFTRLTRRFSMTIEYYIHALVLDTFHYIFCKIHKSLRSTPAMRAGVTGKLCELKVIVDLP